MKNYFTFFEDTILNNIDLEPYNIGVTTNFDKVNEVYTIFKSEKSYDIKRVGEIQAFENWMRGLPSALTVPFANHDILHNAYENNVLSVTSSEKTETHFLDTYFNTLARIFFNLKDNL